MTEREKEKVIKGLECRLDINGSKYKHCLTCDYRHDIDHCQWACQTDGILEDALALLKAQEPRVMTLEEVITSKPGTVVWLEDFNKPDVISGLFKRLFIYTKVIDFLIVKEEVNNEVTADLDVYDSEWRCWTSCPTDEQRKETAWPGA